MKKLPTLVFVVGILILTIIVFYCRKWVQPIQNGRGRNTLEGFENGMKQFDQMQDVYGMERCKALYNPVEITEHATQVRETALGSLRFKEWRPGPKESSQVQPNKTYCYLYDDAKKGIRDPLMGTRTCSTQAWSTGGLVERAFKSTASDPAHNIPTEKCVFEFDNNKIQTDTASATAFWEDIGKTECDALLVPLRRKIAFAEQQIDRLSMEMDVHGQAQTRINDNISSYAGKSNECMKINIDYEAKFVPLDQDINGNLRPAIADAERMLYENLKEWNMYTTLQSERLSDLEEWKKRVEDEKLRYDNCDKDHDDCINDVDKLRVQLSNLETLWDEAVTESNDLNNKIIDVNEDIDSQEAIHRTCVHNRNIATEQYKDYVKEYEKYEPKKIECFRERAEYINLKNFYTPLGEKHGIANDICVNDCKNLEKDIATESKAYTTCDSQKTELERKIREEYLRIRRLKEETERTNLLMVPTESNLRVCQADVAVQQIKIKDLEERKVFLAKLLADMNAMSIENQKEVFKKGVEILHNTTASVLSATTEAHERAQQAATDVSCGPGSLAGQVGQAKVELLQVEQEVEEYAKMLPLPCEDSCADNPDLWTKCAKWINSSAMCKEDPGQTPEPNWLLMHDTLDWAMTTNKNEEHNNKGAGASADTCRAQCDATSWCHAWTWRPKDGGKCWIKNYHTEPESRSAAKIASYSKEENGYFYYNLDGDSYDVEKLTGHNLQSCAANCWNDPRCTVFTLYKDVCAKRAFKNYQEGTVSGHNTGRIFKDRVINIV